VLCAAASTQDARHKTPDTEACRYEAGIISAKQQRVTRMSHPAGGCRRPDEAAPGRPQAPPPSAETPPSLSQACDIKALPRHASVSAAIISSAERRLPTTPRSAQCEQGRVASVASSRPALRSACVVSPMIRGCTADPFDGCTDLDRHYKQHHARSSQNSLLFYCDYSRCTRSSDPFHRLNRLRDHLRKVHKESIGNLPATMNEDQLGDGQASTKWWRCAPCLKRVDLDRHGHKCPDCKARQESKRKDTRQGD
ncbi:Uncharacterized protein TCAP_04695, partial [Tolypocladium capitatum]